ncbi:hypothetical protein CcCBS67573_g01094 [Chytriomyces confervae]|uniref:Uncharacterized protein n=1 Tax=Chytriomyces confervae TaxID=246404 RepID=A0A507FMY0_9FUNG|nr:hypothetical protein CcCBS67573_g01094 [Chytriomyces confervae]
MGQRKNQNATVAAVQHNIQQQPAWTAKMAMNQKASSKPMTRLATPTPQPAQAKPAQIAKPTTPSKQMPARAAPMPVETFSGNMFDLPAQWIASCKPASPVSRMAASAKPKTKKPQFTRKPRAPKNSTSEVFNLQSMFNEPLKWATVQACPPKRMPMQMKPVQQQQQQQRPMQQQMKQPQQQQMKQPQQQQMKQPQQQPAKQMARPTTPAQPVSMEQCMMSMFSEPSGWATQAPMAPKRAAASPTNRNLPNLPAKQQQAAPKKK